jgi:hypothetical protein
MRGEEIRMNKIGCSYQPLLYNYNGTDSLNWLANGEFL